MNLRNIKAAWDKKYTDGKVEFGFNSVAGYTTGLVLEKALAVADSLDQLALRKAISSLSGKLKTLDGTFELDETGAQIGEITPLGQLVPTSTGTSIRDRLSARRGDRQAGLSGVAVIDRASGAAGAVAALYARRAAC